MKVSIIRFENTSFLNCQSGAKGLIYASIEQNNQEKRILDENVLEASAYHLNIKNCTFIQNKSQNGVCMYLENIFANIDESLFEQNSAENEGGAIYFNNESGQGFFNIENSVFKSNAAHIGGALSLHQIQLGDLEKLNVKFVDNIALKGSSNVKEIPSQLAISLDGITMLKSTREQESMDEVIDLVEEGFHFKFPTGQEFGKYLYYDENKQEYLDHQIKFRVFPLNQQGERIKSEYNSTCQLTGYIHKILEIDPEKEGQNIITSEKTKTFSSQTEDYNFDDLLIVFDPEWNRRYYYSISVECSTVEVLIYDQENPEIPQGITKNYKLIINAKSLDCQMGEYLSEGQCLYCNPDQGLYQVKKNQPYCKIAEDYLKGITAAQIELHPGYFRPDQYNDNVEFCYNAETHCLGGWLPGNDSCSQGHIGALCEQCDIYGVRDGTQYSVGGDYTCGKCDDISGNIYIIVLLSLWIILSVLLTVKSTQQMTEYFILSTRKLDVYAIIKHQGNAAILMKIFTNYLQILSAVSTFRIDISNEFLRISNNLADPVQQLGYSLDCFLVGLSSLNIMYSSLLWNFALFVIFALLFLGLSAVAKLIKFNKINNKLLFYTTPAIWNRKNQNDLLIFMLRFLLVSSTRNISGIKWVQSNVAYRADTQEHLYWVYGFGWPMIFIFALAIPFLLYYILREHHKQGTLNKNLTRLKFGYLYNEYLDRAYFWELIQTWKKSLIIFFLIFYEQNITIKGSMIFITVLIYYEMLVRFNPFMSLNLNQLEKACSIIGCFTILCAFIMFTSQERKLDILFWIFYILAGVLNLLLILYILMSIINAYTTQFNEMLDKVRDKINGVFPKLNNYKIFKSILKNQSKSRENAKKNWKLLKTLFMAQYGKKIKKTVQINQSIMHGSASLNNSKSERPSILSLGISQNDSQNQIEFDVSPNYSKDTEKQSKPNRTMLKKPMKSIIYEQEDDVAQEEDDYEEEKKNYNYQHVNFSDNKSFYSQMSVLEHTVDKQRPYFITTNKKQFKN